MKNYIILLISIILLSCIFFYPFKQNQLKFPTEEVNAMGAIGLLENSNNEIVSVGTSKEYDLYLSLKEYNWYLTLLDKEKGNKAFIEELEKQGWTFITQSGSGLSFKKNNKTVIAKREIWYENYLVYRFPLN